MKVVLNDYSYGYFSINLQVATKYFNGEWCDIERTNTALIKLIESGVNCNSTHSYLKIVDIPDNATDWRIIENNGIEYVICVIDGKMHEIH